MELTRRQWIVVTLLACIPLPLLSLATMEIPLPEIVERAATGFVFFSKAPADIRTPVRVVHSHKVKRKAPAEKTKTLSTSVSVSRPAPRTDPTVTHVRRQNGSNVVNVVNQPKRQTQSGGPPSPTDAGGAVSPTADGTPTSETAVVPDGTTKGKAAKGHGSDKNTQGAPGTGTGDDSATTKSPNNPGKGGNGESGGNSADKDDTKTNSQGHGQADVAPSGETKKG